MNEALMAIGVSDTRPACKNIADVTERLKAAMKKVQDFWMGGSEEEKFRIAVAAAAMESPEEDRARIVSSAKALADFSVALQAATRGIDVDFATITIPDDALPLRKLWDEATDRT